MKYPFEYSKTIVWNKLCKIGHWAPLAIPTPDTLVREKNESKNK